MNNKYKPRYYWWEFIENDLPPQPQPQAEVPNVADPNMKATLNEPEEQHRDEIQIITSIPPEMKESLQKFFNKTHTHPNQYYPEDKSDNQAIMRYLGTDNKNYSFRVAAVKGDEILALLDGIPLPINNGQLLVVASYTYGEPTDDKDINQKMIQTAVETAMQNPNQQIQWMVFNDLSKHDDKSWINALEEFGFVQPYRFINPAFKDTVVLVHAIRPNIPNQYPIAAEQDVRNAGENMPENQGKQELLTPTVTPEPMAETWYRMQWH